MKPDHGAAVPESLQFAKDCGKPWRKNMKVKQENDEGETKVPEDGEDELKINKKEILATLLIKGFRNPREKI